MSELSAPGRDFYDEQIRHLEANDVDGLLTQYHDDAVLIGFDFTVKGMVALREHFVEYLERLGSLQLISTDQFRETDDAIFFEATIESDLGVAKVYDVFILKDGKATHQFAGVISVSPRAFPT